MAPVAKNLGKFGALVALETTSYGSGTPALVNTTDGFKIYEPPEVELTMQYDGTREGATGTGMQMLTPIAPAGRSGKVSLVHYFKGSGVAYSASVRASIDRILRGMGMNAAFTGGAGTEIVTYTPIVVDQSVSSLVAEIYNRGQKYSFKGAYVSKFTMDAQGMIVPKCTFDVQGIVTSAPTDAAVPAITAFAPSVKNPKASNLGLTIATGGQTFTPVLRGFTINMEREFAERVDQNDSTGAHPGFYIGDWKATLDLTFEATAVVTGSPYASATAFDVYRVFENMVDLNVALTVGTVQYNKFRLLAPTAHTQNFAKEEREGPIALWTATLQLDPSTEELLDPFSIVTN